MKKFIGILTSVLMISFFQLSFADESGELKITTKRPVNKLSHFSLEENKVIVSAYDENGKPIRGLTKDDFTIVSGSRKTEIVSVETMESSKEVPLNIILVVDNSLSMSKRKAIKPLLAALTEFYKIMRPKDYVDAVTFDETGISPGIPFTKKNLRVKKAFSNNPKELKTFFKNSFKKRLSNQTYLYDSVFTGLSIAKDLPQLENKIIVIFTDGEDNASKYNQQEIVDTVKQVNNIQIYTIDYMPGTQKDPFFSNLSEQTGGQIWKAGSAEEILPIFQSFSNILLYRYLVKYRFLKAPEGSIEMKPDTVTIEEVTVIDSSPLLNYVYFDYGKSIISAKYKKFSSQQDTESFSEKDLRGTTDKYYNTLNIIGKRLKENPDAKITITGCNSNRGKERKNLTLSQERASAVQSYIKYIWGIDPSRMILENRNLPAVPSSGRIKQGRIENQRAEISSDTPGILTTVNSTYTSESCKTDALIITPTVKSDYGIKSWSISVKGDNSLLKTFEGKGKLKSNYKYSIEKADLKKLATFSTINSELKIVDKNGNTFSPDPASTRVINLKREEILASKSGYSIIERYALILFDFNSDEVKGNNQVIVDRIIKRVNKFPSAEVNITGHTDSIGSKKYNLALSQRRAKSVYDRIVSNGALNADRIQYKGEGLANPLYNNGTPEGRALNRTVTISIEYKVTQ